MSRIIKAKKEMSLLTSEELLGIDEQPGDTCVFLDKVLKDLEHALRRVEELSKENDWDLSSIEQELNWTDDYVEEARENVIKIRSWGQQWKDLSKEYFEKYGELDEE